MATIKVKFAYMLLSFFIVYMDTKIIFPSDLETEILRHVRIFGGHFEKNGRH